MVSVGYAELEEKIGGTSKLADYLISQLVEFNATHHPEPIESRSLGDSPAISLILNPARRRLPHGPGPALRPGGPLPARARATRSGSSSPSTSAYLLEDMFAKIRKFGRDHG